MLMVILLCLVASLLWLLLCQIRMALLRLRCLSLTIATHVAVVVMAVHAVRVLRCVAAFVVRVQLGVAGVGRDQQLLETLIRQEDVLRKVLHSALQGALIVLAIVELRSVRLEVLGEQVEIVLRALVVGHRILVRPLGIVRSKEFQSRFYPALIRHIETGCFGALFLYPALPGTYPAFTRHWRLRPHKREVRYPALPGMPDNAG